MTGTMRPGGPPSPSDPVGETDGAGTGPSIEGAGGVAFDPGGRVLVIRQRNGSWVFPKGHLDPGEDHLAAALREVEEEAGIDARCAHPDRSWSTDYVNDRGEPRHVVWFRLEAPAGAVPRMREAQFPEGAFVTPDEALQRLSFAEDRALLRRIVDATAGAGTGGGGR